MARTPPTPPCYAPPPPCPPPRPPPLPLPPSLLRDLVTTFSPPSPPTAPPPSPPSLPRHPLHPRPHKKTLLPPLHPPRPLLSPPAPAASPSSNPPTPSLSPPSILTPSPRSPRRRRRHPLPHPRTHHVLPLSGRTLRRLFALASLRIARDLPERPTYELLAADPATPSPATPRASLTLLRRPLGVRPRRRGTPA